MIKAICKILFHILIQKKVFKLNIAKQITIIKYQNKLKANKL